MTSNLDRFRTDLEELIEKGQTLEFAIHAQAAPDEFQEEIMVRLGKSEAEVKKMVAGFPSFRSEYQLWYSEAKALIRQLMPDRLDDFSRHYEKPKTRKDITFENYHIEDYLQGLTVTRRWETEPLVGPKAAVPRFQQQLAILKAARARFESSLFDIRQLSR